MGRTRGGDRRGGGGASFSSHVPFGVLGWAHVDTVPWTLYTHAIEARRTGVTNSALHWSLTNLVRPSTSVEEGVEKHVG